MANEKGGARNLEREIGGRDREEREGKRGVRTQ